MSDFAISKIRDYLGDDLFGKFKATFKNQLDIDEDKSIEENIQIALGYVVYVLSKDYMFEVFKKYAEESGKKFDVAGVVENVLKECDYEYQAYATAEDILNHIYGNTYYYTI